jgi:hypothetical protein
VPKAVSNSAIANLHDCFRAFYKEPVTLGKRSEKPISESDVCGTADVAEISPRKWANTIASPRRKGALSTVPKNLGSCCYIKCFETVPFKGTNTPKGSGIEIQDSKP